MIIKVCGLREPANIAEISALGVDMTGFIFHPASKRYVRQIASNNGTLPDRSTIGETVTAARKPLRVGVFVDDMPQNIITRVYNSHLDCIQLHGNETPTYIDNLRSTLVPGIVSDIKIIKALSVREADDVKRWREYGGHVDMFLFDTKCDTHGGSGQMFDWSVLDAYDGKIPFLLSGGIGPDDVERVMAFSHPSFIGIDINSRFETEPGMKDVGLVRDFISKLKRLRNAKKRT